MLSQQLKDRIDDILIDELGCEKVEITPNANPQIELGADSLDMVELAMRYEEEFEIEIADSDCEKWQTVQNLYDYLEQSGAVT